MAAFALDLLSRGERRGVDDAQVRYVDSDPLRLGFTRDTRRLVPGLLTMLTRFRPQSREHRMNESWDFVSNDGRAEVDVAVAWDRDSLPPEAQLHPVFRSVIPGDAVGL
jgi:hypothetical protein